MTLPAAHPEVDGQKAGKACPVTGKTHEYSPPTATDIRSVCPALNAMANHGYLPRDGRNISIFDVFWGLKACYGLSTFLAAFLTLGGWLAILRLGRVSLFNLGMHNRVEHDASAVHHDCPPRVRLAPTAIDQGLLNDFARHVVEDASADIEGELPEDEVVVTGEDIVRLRLRREATLAKPLDPLHGEIARGEFAIILGVWNKTVKGREGVPLPWMRMWLGQERLPDGWRPDHVQSFRDVVKRAGAMRAEMKRIRDGDAAAAKTK